MSNVIGALKAALSAPRNDGSLHFSQHLQHDRHTALYNAYGYPESSKTWGSIFPLLQGTGVHETIHATMDDLYSKYVPEHEIKAPSDTFMYDWIGTADAYVEIDDQVWLLDYKTISGVGMSFLEDTPKPEHILQVSAYYHFGPTQDCKTGVLYLPSSPDYRKRWEEPRLIEFEPLSYADIVKRMKEVEAACDEYENTMDLPKWPKGDYTWKKKGKKYELVYRPHYTTLFCPWATVPDDPCGCSEAKGRLIATYIDGDYQYDPLDEDILIKMGGPLDNEPFV